MTAAKVIMAQIRDKKYDTSTYPKTTYIHNTIGDWIPKLLKTFLQVIVRSELRVLAKQSSKQQNQDLR